MRRRALPGPRQLGGHHRLAAHGALGGREDVGRHAPGRVRHAAEPGEARHVDHVRPPAALHDVDAEEVDAEGGATPVHDVGELGRDREGSARFVRPRGPGPEHAEQLGPDRVHGPIRPVRRMVPLSEQWLLDGRQRRQLRRVRDHFGSVLLVAAVRLDDERAAVQSGQQLARVRRGERLGHGHARGPEHPERHDPVAQQGRNRVGVEQLGTGPMQIRRHTHREVAAALQDEQVMVRAHAGDVDEVVAEMQRLGRRPPLPQPAHNLAQVAIFGERPPHQEANPHSALR